MTSKPPCRRGRSSAPAIRNVTEPSSIELRANDTNAGEGSQATTEAGSARWRTALVRAPVPQPTSSQFARGIGASQSRKSSATRRLHLPMKVSYASPAAQLSIDAFKVVSLRVPPNGLENCEAPLGEPPGQPGRVSGQSRTPGWPARHYRVVA